MSRKTRRAKRQQETESRAIAKTYGELFAQLDGGSNSLSGERVTVSKMMSLGPFFQACELISGDVAKLPLNRFVRNGEDRTIDKSHPTQTVIRRRPNYFQNSYDFWRQLLVQRLIYQAAYAYIERDADGNAIELYPLLSDRTEIIHEGRQVYVVTEVGGQLFPLPYENVFHLKGLAWKDFVNTDSLLHTAKDLIGEMLATRGFSSKFFKNGGRVGGILELPHGTTKKTADALEEGFRKTYESNDAPFKTVIARDGAKFHQAQLTPNDMQMVDVKNASIASVASFFNLPPHKLGDTSRTSFSSLEQENRSYYDNCLSHYLAEVKAEADAKLRTLDEQEADDTFYDYNIHALNWADVQTIAAVGNGAIINSWMTPNEVRKLFNLPHMEGGDSLIQQLNTVKVTPQPDTQSQQDAVRAVYNETAIRACNRIGIQLKKQAKQLGCVKRDTELEADIEEMLKASKKACEAVGVQCESGTELYSRFVPNQLGEMIIGESQIDAITKGIRSEFE